METHDCCCGCFAFGKKKKSGKDSAIPNIHIKRFSKEHLLGYSIEEIDKATHKAGRQAAKSPLNHYSPPYDDNSAPASKRPSFKELPPPPSSSSLKEKVAVKDTRHVVRSQDFDGNKMVNEYVRQYKIGTGSYGKVVLYRSKKDDKQYAIKIFHKSRLCKLRVSPTETAMMDVLREVAIMKQLDHPNIVKLLEVIDDPESDHFYMVLEYVGGNWIFEGCGPPGGIGNAVARRYFRDAVAGLMYLHDLNIVHGDIKPENLLISRDGNIKICDFGVSRIFEGDVDVLRRSPGTPVYTAPECCLGLTYRGKPADIWALGCTLYCMVTGCYPFVGDTLQSTYDKIVNDTLFIPDDMDPDLSDLLKGLLCKDAKQRLSLAAITTHPWVTRGFGPVQQDPHNNGYGQQLHMTATPPPYEARDNGSIELARWPDSCKTF